MGSGVLVMGGWRREEGDAENFGGRIHELDLKGWAAIGIRGILCQLSLRQLEKLVSPTPMITAVIIQ